MEKKPTGRIGPASYAFHIALIAAMILLAIYFMATSDLPIRIDL